MKKQITLLAIILAAFTWGGQAAMAQDEYDSLTVGSKAPSFYLPTFAGEEFYLNDYCGKLRQPWKNDRKHFVVLSFFTTECGTCLKEIPQMQESFEKFAGEELKVFPINIREREEIVAPFLRRNRFKFPVLVDRYGTVSRKYQVGTVPKHVLIDRDGRIVLISNGDSTDVQERIMAEVTRLLAPQP